MKFFQTDPYKDVQALGSHDGGVDQDHADDYVTMHHGHKPVIAPQESMEHALWLRESNPELLDALTLNLHEIENALVVHQPRWLLLVLLVVVFLIEVESGILFWKDQGLTGITRIVMAAATAATTIFFPWLLVELALSRKGKE